tara:strand:- start:107 stop:718 length:612 start_codon:yes stop_codon:yes gene_type:complete
MKRAVLVVVMMLFMSVGLNAQHDPNWVGEWKITPMETEMGWEEVEDLWEDASRLFEFNNHIRENEGSGWVTTLTSDEIIRLKCIYAWGHIYDLDDAIEAMTDYDYSRTVFCSECADYVTIPFKITSPHTKIYNILKNDASLLIGGAYYQTALRELKEIADTWDDGEIVTNPDDVHPVIYLSSTSGYIMSDREACKRFCSSSRR